MKTHWIALLLISAVGIGLVAGRVTAGEHAEKDGADADAGADAGAMATPGTEHKEMAKLAGDWSATMTYYMPGGAGEMSSEDSETSKMVMNGWFLQSDYNGEMMGQKWAGRSVLGYNQMTREYEMAWYSQMGSPITLHKGKKCPKGIIHLYGNSPNSATGTMAPAMIQMYPTDEKGSHKMEMHFVDENKKSTYKMMQIVYKKK